MTADKLLDRLQKIKRSAEGEKALGNEAAAQAFADLLNKLLLDNKLEMTDLEFEKFEEEQPVDRHYIDYTKYPDIRVKQRRIEWLERLAGVVANAHFCRILVHQRSSRITLVGRKDDCEVVEYLLITLQRAAEKLSQSAYEKFWWDLRDTCYRCKRREKQHPAFDCSIFSRDMSKAAGFRAAFLDAFITRLFHRFNELRTAREGESTALVRINRSEKAVNQWIEDNVTGSAKGLTRARAWNESGRKQGVAAADAIELRANAMKGAKAKGQIGG